MKKMIPFLFVSLLLVGAGCSEPQASDDTLDALTELGIDIKDVIGEEEENIDDETTSAVPADGNTEVDEIVVEDEPESVSDPELESDDTTSEEGQDLVEEEDELETLSVSMESGNFFFSPSTITAEPGQTIRIAILQNSGTHTFVIDEIGYKSSVGSGDVLTFTAPTEPGSYAYYCDVGSHRSLGMEGVLIVN